MDQIEAELKDPVKAKRDAIQYFHDHVFRLNFYRVHMAYFVVIIAVSSAILYGEGLANDNTEIGGTKLRYIDALFMAASALTTTGLSVVNLSDLTAFQQAVLAILLLLGNVAFVSTSSVMIRLYFFRKKLDDIVMHSKSSRKVLEDVEQQETHSSGIEPVSLSSNEESTGTEHTSGVRKRKSMAPRQRSAQNSRKQSQASPTKEPGLLHQCGFGGIPAPWELKSFRDIANYAFPSTPQRGYDQKHHHYISFEPTFDERGRFIALTEYERAELGGVEYRALKALLWILGFYQIFWILMGVVFLVPYAYRADIAAVIRNSQPGNLNPGWWAFFAGISSFSNCGLNLLNSNFEPFYANYFLLIVAMILTIAGQTHFPVFLRWLIWTLKALLPKESRARSDLQFLLQHPRRCFIYMFPSRETWLLLTIQFVIDATAWVLFEILNLGVPAVMAIAPGPRTLDGLFQSVGLRTSGSYIINISDLAPALLVAYIVAMYISSFPIVMALRQTNSYEEKSIGLDQGEAGGGLTAHLRRQLAYDIWFQILAWFLIAIIQRPQLTGGQSGFGLFYLLFEVTSAYGTVGLSTGVPGQDFSLSGEFKTLSKVIMILVMVRGRHRGLPYAIDRSILLPGEDLMHRLDAHYNQTGTISESDEEEVREDEEDSVQNSQGLGMRLDMQAPQLEQDGTHQSKDEDQQDVNHRAKNKHST